jgi:hypothetical protein
MLIHDIQLRSETASKLAFPHYAFVILTHVSVLYKLTQELLPQTFYLL